MNVKEIMLVTLKLHVIISPDLTLVHVKMAMKVMAGTVLVSLTYSDKSSHNRIVLYVLVSQPDKKYNNLSGNKLMLVPIESSIISSMSAKEGQEPIVWPHFKTVLHIACASNLRQDLIVAFINLIGQ